VRIVPVDGGWRLFGEQTGSINGTLAFARADTSEAAIALLRRAAGELAHG
jgi:hypothetical protein